MTTLLIGLDQMWLDMLDKIACHCPNITKLHLLYSNCVPLAPPLALIQHYADQLQEVYIPYLGDLLELKFDVCNFVAQHLNPKCLTVLSIPFFEIHPTNLEQIVNKFVLLRKLGLSVYDWHDDENNFDCLKKLIHLQELHCDLKLSDYAFGTLINSLIGSNLHCLNLNRNVDGILPSSLQLLAKLITLRRLMICGPTTGQNPCANFVNPCLQALQCLPHLTELNLFVRLCNSNEQSLNDFFRALSRLKSLQELNLNFDFIGQLKFHSLAFPSIPWISKLQFVCDHFDEQRAKGRTFKRRLHQHLPDIFPNLIQFHLTWITIPLDDLLRCLDKLIKLRCLYLYSHYLAGQKDERMRLQKYCEERKIALKAF